MACGAIGKKDPINCTGNCHGQAHKDATYDSKFGGTGNGGRNPGCVSCSNDCERACGACAALCGPKQTCSRACSEGCGSGCSHGCSGNCDSGCYNTCRSGCYTSCSSGCSGTCETACALGCATGCSISCSGECNYGCTSEEVNNLFTNLHLSRIAEVEDINAIKQIIFKLFENMKKSSLYKDGDPICENEFGGLDAGLVQEWKKWDSNDKVSFSLLLDKTFQAVINNLKNINKNRINFDEDKATPAKTFTHPDSKVIYNTVDRNAAEYWIECLKELYPMIMPMK